MYSIVSHVFCGVVARGGILYFCVLGVQYLLFRAVALSNETTKQEEWRRDIFLVDDLTDVCNASCGVFRVVHVASMS